MLKYAHYSIELHPPYLIVAWKNTVLLFYFHYFAFLLTNKCIWMNNVHFKICALDFSDGSSPIFHIKTKQYHDGGHICFFFILCISLSFVMCVITRRGNWRCEKNIFFFVNGSHFVFFSFLWSYVFKTFVNPILFFWQIFIIRFRTN